MSIEAGWFVLNINRKDWGLGEVAEVCAGEAKVIFESPVGEKRLPLELLIRDPDDAPPPPPLTREQHLETVMSRFFHIANREGIEKLEDKVRRFVAGENPLWGEIEAQLGHWIDTNPEGRHAHAAPHARVLLEFLRDKYST